jgi:Holliday junction resolvase RusA-like endonuclease
MEGLQVTASCKNIYQSIISAMAEIEPIAKGRKNQQQGFIYRGIDEIMNELQPVLKNNGMFVVPEVLHMIREEKQTKNGGTLLYSVLTMKYTFYAADGSSVSAVVIGEGMDSGDKASNKAMAVAMKYALLQVFCIPTDDAKDPDAESYSVKTTSKPAVDEFANIEKQLIDLMNKNAFEHPENVRAVIAQKKIDKMKEALQVGIKNLKEVK